MHLHFTNTTQADTLLVNEALQPGEREREVGRSIFGAFVRVFMLLCWSHTPYNLVWGPFLFCCLSLCFNVCGHRELSSDTVQVPRHLLRMKPPSPFSTYCICWHPPVNFDPVLSFFLCVFFKMKLNPIHVIKKCWVFPLFLEYVFLRGEQMALETDIS